MGGREGGGNRERERESEDDTRESCERVKRESKKDDKVQDNKLVHCSDLFLYFHFCIKKKSALHSTFTKVNSINHELSICLESTV